MKITDNSVYRNDLATNVSRLEYDFMSRTGKLYMPDLMCCDMTGCIALFAAIDCEVEKICAFSGVRLDVVYLKRRQGWLATHPDESFFDHRHEA